MKRRVRAPAKPIPPLLALELDSDIVVSFLYSTAFAKFFQSLYSFVTRSQKPQLRFLERQPVKNRLHPSFPRSSTRWKSLSDKVLIEPGLNTLVVMVSSVCLLSSV